jgi:hypothetical protein
MPTLDCLKETANRQFGGVTWYVILNSIKSTIILLIRIKVGIIIKLVFSNGFE